ncbi:MAG: hypothetical protein M3071_11735 [Actinomycetota bacterium]|nr:hypothetical protein [Actinomycetota bacterium]
MAVELDVDVEVTGAATAGAEATGVAATTEDGTTVVGAGVALAAGVEWWVVPVVLRCTVGTENEGDGLVGAEEAAGAAGWLATDGPDVDGCGATTAKAADALPPVGFDALIT